MSHWQSLGNQFNIPLEPDSGGYIGRECPASPCNGYFKVTPGTGASHATYGYCAYCGETAAPSSFATAAQVDYARSVVVHQVTGALLRDLKELEFEHQPRGAFGLGFSLQVTGQPHPIHYYREETLETEVVCDHCSLRYAIYGLFAFCPDCGVHNSRHILQKNLEIAQKELELATTISGDLADHLIGDALENAVAAFDGFGREACRVHPPRAPLPAQASPWSFQNLNGARRRIQTHYGADIAASVSTQDWDFMVRCFQKRHLLSHRMGVVDAEYLRATNDPEAIEGRKILITAVDVRRLLSLLTDVGDRLVAALNDRQTEHV